MLLEHSSLKKSVVAHVVDNPLLPVEGITAYTECLDKVVQTRSCSLLWHESLCRRLYDSQWEIRRVPKMQWLLLPFSL